MDGAEGLEVRRESGDGVTVLTLHGELDLDTAPVLRAHLADALDDGTDVVVDLCEVEFVDSSGLAALLNALRRLTRAQRRMALACGDGPVMRILRITRLDDTFRVFDTARAAVASMRERPAAG